MQFKPPVLSLIVMAGMITVASYGLYGGNIRPGTDGQLQAAGVNRSFSGAAAGGRAPGAGGPDCRSCTRKARQ